MSEILYIRLTSKPQLPISWLVWSNSQKEIIASGELADAHALVNIKDKAENRQVIAIAPSSDVSLKALKVPGKSQKSIRQAVPYMLEDELAQEVDDLFFAFANIKHDSNDHNCFTAIVERSKMQQWLSWLSDAGISCQQLIPEALLLPLHEQHWTVIAINEQFVIRQGRWQGVSLDNEQWSFMANQWQQLDPVPTLHHYSPIADLPVVVETVAEPEELPLALYAQYPSNDINLLQGQFAVKRERSPARKYWLIAASLFAVTLLLNIGSKASQLYQLNQQNALLEQQIIANYKQAFPQTKRVRISTIKSQLKRKIAEAGGSSNSEGFLPMLAKLQVAFKQVPELQTNSLKFDSKRQELRIQAEANNYQSFEKFKSLLEQSRLQVSQGAQNNQGDRVTGSFSIKG
ncbi:type II secretion system protein GspL [Thalassotalea sp. M1531]|uniref:Type II secretion system protein L n=1 Tax=Thalassotalea algicola TaxID=2716224 RepID=A0A7Y0Q4W5_9GAMM|nr:type II secretion system protein GspL [Thalassotalea algicola]NMP30424.1 type II secretion system protein GspL [Thalassotalea algicola]